MEHTRRYHSNFTKEPSLMVAIILFITLGTVVFLSGLNSPFIGDDFPQIVNNPVVHSVSNVGSFFTQGTFYNGTASEKLSGSYRPLMMVSFSLLYSIFGAYPLAFHLFMLTIVIANAILLFLVFKYFLRPNLSFVLAAIFLIHPLNSQMVFSIPVTQDGLFFFFGILGFWLLVKFQNNSPWYLLPTASCILLSLFSKETGIVFLAISLLYLFMTDKKRLYFMLGLVVVVLAIYLPFKVQAVGFAENVKNAPIGDMDLMQRLINVPELVMFYMTRFIFPVSLAQAYYWARETVTLRHFTLPLLFDIGCMLVLAYAGYRLFKLKQPRLLTVFIFFIAWFVIGLAPHLQIVPLDMTASETWFYFSMAGLLGAIGAVYQGFDVRVPWRIGAAIAVIIVMVLGTRTFVRGFDWQNQTKLAYKNVSVSKEDYISYNLIANYLLKANRLQEAKQFSDRSINVYPSFTNYNTLGGIDFSLGKYDAARDAYKKAIKYGGDYQAVYDNLALLYAVSGDESTGKAFYTTAVAKFPHDANIWFYLAVFANNYGYHDVAQTALSQSEKHGYYDADAFEKISSGQPYTLYVSVK